MCGIVGILEPIPLRGAAVARIDAMTDALAHRGPDGRGTWSDSAAGVHLGHRRLAILDLSETGHQPMESRNGRYIIVYNGETYNFDELRSELVDDGVAFRGRSDTEVLLEGFSAWGVRATLERTVGMAALAVWDRQDRVLTLARDRFGEKPLYYGWIGQRFLFASELKAITVDQDFEGRIDQKALAMFFRFAHVPSPHCIWAGFHKLSPGSLLQVRPGDSAAEVEPVQYWEPREVAGGARRQTYRDERAAVNELDPLLRATVRRALVADVPVGVFLSGGVDSSLVAALAQAETRGKVKTFTIGFDEDAFDEANHARAVAKHLGTDHTEIRLGSEAALQVIPRLGTIYDEPFADSSQIPSFLVAALARQHVTVALSGDGGDELFAGYTRHIEGARWIRRMHLLPRRFRLPLARLLLKAPPRLIEHFGRALPSQRTRRGRFAEKVTKLGEALLDANPYEAMVRCWRDDENPALHGRPLNSPATSPVPLTTEEIMLRDTLQYLPDDVLTKVDRAAMANSLEVRAPLLSHQVFEAAWRLSHAMRVRRGRGKRILRQILYRYVPRHLVDRPKTGFAIPLDEWLRGPLRSWAHSTLDPARLEMNGLLRVDVVQKKWDEHISGRHNWYHQLWAVLMFQTWMEANRHLIKSRRTEESVVVHA